MTEVYRDSCGRFAPEKRATFKQTGDQHFVRLFGRWAELKPVTAESFKASMDRYDEALRRAL
jgi:hypothetical protein